MNDNRQHDLLVQRSRCRFHPCPDAHGACSNATGPVMVHGASATTQFMRAATQQQQQGKDRVPVGAGRQKPPRPRRGIGSSRTAACTTAERQAARPEPDASCPGAPAVRPRASALGRDPNPGRLSCLLWLSEQVRPSIICQISFRLVSCPRSPSPPICIHVD